MSLTISEVPPSLSFPQECAGCEMAPDSAPAHEKKQDN